ncbi:hypothetical protein TNCV_4096441 [Trichonephila clavipes]|nr:hypothetical protein TNCV_4096441 [Trichonephila clavipes]
MIHARFSSGITKTARKSAHQQRCRPHTASGGTVEHKQIPRARISPATTAILATRASSESPVLHKKDSSYGPRGRSLGRRGQESVPANLPDHLVQSTVLDMLYPMHFAQLRYNVHLLRHVGTTYEPLCWLEYFAVELYILTYS